LQPTPSKTAVLNKNRLLSSLFGWRTLTQLDGKVPLPSAIDDEYLLEDGEGVQPPARPSLLDSFIATIKIFDVFHRAPAINDGYFARALCLPELAQVLQLNEELDQIDAGLPAHLRSDNPEKPSTRRGRALSLQAVAVKIRLTPTLVPLNHSWRIQHLTRAQNPAHPPRAPPAQHVGHGSSNNPRTGV
jgi:hypothetical protein